eukprot:CAMPEP_0167825760 /NCGR_PEP_ID=MMETSP0112_2-20121227/9579_1 /TAXON_ID=91324 /ORGANISM="Lotharella globosa, Strain CCCM811" /LENGTH=332 /DNA_ID=CAMNT_0007727971 /DNA_START=63 /DNA_END=1062 /DNA_ORIENTATION=-
MTCNFIPQILSITGDGDGDRFYAVSEGELYGMLLTFHLLFGLLVTCLVLAATSSPGYIPRDTEQDRKRWVDGDFQISDEDDAKVKAIIQNTEEDLTDKFTIAWLKSIVILERKKQYGYYRHCAACNLYKPDRTHHCRICDRCILRMDHHCPWISNCVGFRNYKYFLLALFYVIACLGGLRVGGLGTPRWTCLPPNYEHDQVHSRRPARSDGLPPLVMLFIAFSLFFTFHINLTLNNMTTIELKEKKNNGDRFIRHRFKVAHTKFDNGYWNNFTAVFGPVWMWLLPIFPGGTGTYLGASAEGKYTVCKQEEIGDHDEKSGLLLTATKKEKEDS